MMYAIKIKLSEHKKNRVTERLLKKRYKTLTGAEKAAKNWRWVCLPEGNNGPISEECSAWVITL